MNYNNIQEIWDSGVTNMTVVVNNVKHDDDLVQVTPPSWLIFNNTSVSTLYCSGNSFIGVSSSTENIKMNRRDTAMYYLYTEEGTILNTYNFFRIRWVGYSYYSSTSSSTFLRWEVIFFDDGDIQLKFDAIPTSYTDGTKSLVADKTYTFNMSSETPNISFKYNSSNNTFEQSYGVLVKLPAFKYLIRDNTTIYTIQDGSLVNLGDIQVDSNLFETSGFDSVDKDILLSFNTPELLTYNIVSNKTSLVARGAPLPKTLIVKVNNLNGEKSCPIHRARRFRNQGNLR